MWGERFLHLSLPAVIIRLAVVYAVAHSTYDLWKIWHKKDIHQAAATGDVARVKELLPKTKPQELVRNDGRGTVLHVAVIKGHLDVARALLNYGLDVDALNDTAQSPLYFAVEANRDDIGTMLLDHGAYQNRVDAFGLTPLLMAAQSNAVDCIELLAGRGADISYAISSVNYDQLTSSRFFTSEMRTEARVKLKDAVGITPLLIAATRGHVETVQCLLRLGSNVQAAISNGETALYAAVVAGHVECAKALVEHGADVNVTIFADSADRVGAAPIHVGVTYGNRDLVGLLLSNGAHANQQSVIGTPLYIAQHRGQEDIIQTLQAYDAVAVAGNI